MAAGKINLQANDGSIVGAYVPDGLGSGDRALSFGPSLSGITAYHLLQGNLAVSTSTITQGFNTTLYTGNGSTQSITTGIDMSTQWGNDASEKFGGLVWVKSRSTTDYHLLHDTVRGAGYYLFSNTTSAEGYSPSQISSFNSDGFTVGTAGGSNGSGNAIASWNFQTTHRVTGTTNHGKAYTCHYNPFTGFTIVKYEGSGLAGHEIPHHLGRKLGFVTFKNLSTTSDWFSTYLSGDNYLYLNLTTASQYSGYAMLGDIKVSLPNNSVSYNASTNQYIMYGWANSYLDESNKLIGNYEIGVYQGTGVAGNKVTTRGKPAWVMVKRLDSTGDWVIFDNKRTPDQFLSANTSTAEAGFSGNHSLFEINGFTLDADSGYINASGGQYLYMVAYDTNSNGSGSYYPLASDTANVQVNNALIPIAQGIDSNGAKNTILSKNETFNGVTYTQGKNYPYYDALGNRGVSVHRPRYLENELVRTYAGESPDYYDVESNKWFNCDTGYNLYPNSSFLIVPDGEIGHDNGNGTVDGYENLLGGTASIDNGRLKVSGNQWATARIQLSGLVAGKRYKIVVGTTEKGNATSPYVEINSDNDAKIIINERNYMEFIPNGTTKYIRFVATSTAESGVYAYFDNISVFEAVIKPTTEITNGRNYLNHIVYADNDGGVLYVEELPKIEYKDIVKANEFKGKNACTAWVNFDGTTTPPTIRDSYNVSAVIRAGTGVYDIYFKEPMDNTMYSKNITGDVDTAIFGASQNVSYPNSLNKCTIRSYNVILASTNGVMTVSIFGGKNS